MRRGVIVLSSIALLVISGSAALLVVGPKSSPKAVCAPLTLAHLFPEAPPITVAPAPAPGTADPATSAVQGSTGSTDTDNPELGEETGAAVVGELLPPEPAPAADPETDQESAGDVPDTTTTTLPPPSTSTTTVGDAPESTTTTTILGAAETPESTTTTVTTTTILGAAETTTTTTASVSTPAESTTTTTGDTSITIGTTPTPNPGDSVDQGEQSPSITREPATGGSADADCVPFAYRMVFPVVGHGDVISVFGDDRPQQRHHAGVDIAADKMTPVVAVADGTVIRAPGDNDCCVVGLRHTDGWTSWYIHLNNDSWGTDDGLGWGVNPGIAVGTSLRAGDVLGWVGDSGNAETTTPHLHFELRLPDGNAIDPLQSIRVAQQTGEESFRGAFIDDDESPQEEAVNLLASLGVFEACDAPRSLHACPDEPATAEMVDLLLQRLLGRAGPAKSWSMPETAVLRSASQPPAPLTGHQMFSRVLEFSATGSLISRIPRIADLQVGAGSCASGLDAAGAVLSRGEAAAALAVELGLMPCQATLRLEGTAGLRVVFSAFDRTRGVQGIYVAGADGADPVLITPDDGLQYSWPSWAFGGTKIVFSARRGAPGNPENIYMMDPDGSNRRQLTLSTWRNAQPKVSPDGMRLLFTSMWEEFPEVALYSMDLGTTLVSNLSALATTHGGFDSDPKWSEDGSKIVFANSADPERGTVPTQVFLMDSDGSNREALTDDEFFNTDPELSPDGAQVAIASYRGEGHPGREDPDDPFATKLSEWFLVLKDIRSGVETILNEGEECFKRPAADKCDVLEGPAWIPRWTPDGSAVGFVSVRSSRTVCICVTQTDGSGAQPLVESDTLAITWFDWVLPGAAPPGALERIGAEVPAGRLLFGGKADGVPVLGAGSADRWSTGLVSLDDRLTPESARWSPDRTKIVFNARVDFDPKAFEPWPSPPSGQRRHVHFTLDTFGSIFFPPVERRNVAEEQIFLLDIASGEVRQLTTPWIEDYMDAIPDGDARGNVDPEFSPDGRHIVFTNISSTSHESFLLRLDLETGEVYSLTNATSGAVPVADHGPRYSRDGSLIAFSSTIGLVSDIYLIHASDGRSFTQVTDDDFFDISPAWSPDGRYIVYSSYRGDEPLGLEDDPATAAVEATIPLDDWVLVKVDVHTRQQTVLTAGAPAFRPTWSPDGSKIAFISISSPGQPDIYTIDADGGTPRPVQVTLRTQEVFFDWR